MTELNDIGVEESAYTLADKTEEYMLERQIFNEKYYPSFLKYAQNAWSEIVQDTLYAFNARWIKLELKSDGTYYIPFPRDCKNFISANLVDNCGLTKRIPYNSSVNVIPKPQPSSCDCGAIISTFITTTKYMFSSGGIDYYQKTYLKYCPNGDIIERVVTPTKKYADYVGDQPGDYNEDFNDDYSHEAESFSNFTIINSVDQRVLVNLDTNEDGTPKNTEENVKKLDEFCGCYSLFNNCCSNLNPVLQTEDIGLYGCVTLSENRRYLVYTPPSTFRSLCSESIPDYVLVYFKASSKGNEITGAAIIPDDFFINNALILGIEYYSKRVNPTFSINDKKFARSEFNHSLNELIRSKLFMNTDVMQRISTGMLKW